MIRKHYSKYWKMYVDCRYPVMRVDIGRVPILHRYGGLYSDMDVWPNRPEYEQSRLAVCQLPAGLTANEKPCLDVEV